MRQLITITQLRKLKVIIIFGAYSIAYQQAYLANLQYQSQLQFLSTSVRTMQEFQSFQFQYMINSHTQIMNKLIDKVMD